MVVNYGERLTGGTVPSKRYATFISANVLIVLGLLIQL
jgi:hypothetical protein